jgi:hypothetical protein
MKEFRLSRLQPGHSESSSRFGVPDCCYGDFAVVFTLLSCALRDAEAMDFHSTRANIQEMTTWPSG